MCRVTVGQPVITQAIMLQTADLYGHELSVMPCAVYPTWHALQPPRAGFPLICCVRCI